MSCKLEHVYVVFPEGAEPPVYEGANPGTAAAVLASNPHSDDFSSGAFVVVSHRDESYCADETACVEADASTYKAF